MDIKGCGGCGNCQDFKCPVGAFTYGAIDKSKCVNCGLCKNEIDCLCEAIQDDNGRET